MGMSRSYRCRPFDSGHQLCRQSVTVKLVTLWWWGRETRAMMETNPAAKLGEETCRCRGVSGFGSWDMTKRLLFSVSRGKATACFSMLEILPMLQRVAEN